MDPFTTHVVSNRPPRFEDEIRDIDDPANRDELMAKTGPKA